MGFSAREGTAPLRWPGRADDPSGQALHARSDARGADLRPRVMALTAGLSGSWQSHSAWAPIRRHAGGLGRSGANAIGTSRGKARIRHPQSPDTWPKPQSRTRGRAQPGLIGGRVTHSGPGFTHELPMPLARERHLMASGGQWRAQARNRRRHSATKEETGPGCGPASLHGVCDLDPRPPRRVVWISS